MRKFILQEDLAQKLVTYLVSRPYMEVHGILKEIEGLQLVDDQLAKNVSDAKKTADQIHDHSAPGV